MPLPTIEVKHNGVTVEVSTKTPRLDMYRNQITNIIAGFNEDLANDLGVQLGVSDQLLIDFAEHSVLCTVIDGELDFEFASITDDGDTIRAKFEAYLDTAFYPIVQRIENAIYRLSRPIDPTIAPNSPQTDEKKSSGGKTGKKRS